MSISTPCPTQQAFAHALLDAGRPVPTGLTARQGCDVAARLAVHRNNVVASLIGVLADTFPVVRQLVGDEYFEALARIFVCAHPPASPVMSDYGDAFADWIADFEPLTAWPYLPDMARLERARVRALCAADGVALPRRALQAMLADAEGLPQRRLHLHPSLQLLRSPFAVVSLWAAHQQEDESAIGRVPWHGPEAAIVLRRDDDVLVLPCAPAAAEFTAAILRGAAFGAAAAPLRADDLTTALALLIEQGALVAEPAAGDAA